MSAAQTSFIASVKRALRHDSVEEWLSASEYLDALEEINWHLDAMLEKARRKVQAQLQARGGK